jgi:hypothetical protein
MTTWILLILGLAGEGFMFYALFHFLRDTKHRRNTKAPASVSPAKDASVIRITDAAPNLRKTRPNQRAS